MSTIKIDISHAALSFYFPYLVLLEIRTAVAKKSNDFCFESTFQFISVTHAKDMMINNTEPKNI